MSQPHGQSARDANTGATTDVPAGTPPGGTAPQTGETARQYVPRPTQSLDDASRAEPRPTGAVLGFTVTAAVLMMLSGIWNFLEGLAAIIKGQFFVVLPNYVYNVSVTGWGWWHLIVGVLVFAVGAGLLFWDSLWARVAGVAVASLSAITNFLYIPYSPVWSVVVIILDAFIIWALLAPRTRYAD